MVLQSLSDCDSLSRLNGRIGLLNSEVKEINNAIKERENKLVGKMSGEQLQNCDDYEKLSQEIQTMLRHLGVDIDIGKFFKNKNYRMTFYKNLGMKMFTYSGVNLNDEQKTMLFAKLGLASFNFHHSSDKEEDRLRSMKVLYPIASCLHNFNVDQGFRVQYGRWLGQVFSEYAMLNIRMGLDRNGDFGPLRHNSVFAKKGMTRYERPGGRSVEEKSIYINLLAPAVDVKDYLGRQNSL